MQGKNRGSAIIEFTLLVPILFGCIYFYIMSMLFIVEHGKLADALSKRLYSNEKSMIELLGDSGGQVHKEGNTEIIEYLGNYEKYDIVLELKKDGSEIVKNLRRWQLVADTVH